MNRSHSEQTFLPIRLSTLVLAFATTVFVVLMVRIGWHPDDAHLIGEFATTQYSDAWTSTFLGRFYRPLTVTLLRLSIDVFGLTPVPLRILQGALLATMVWLVAGLFPRGPIAARNLGGLCVMASPFTLISITPFAIGFADSVVGICLLLCFKFALADARSESSSRTPFLWLFLCLLAVSMKESGILVIAFCFLHCSLRRRWRLAAGFAAFAAAYLALRSSIVTPMLYAFNSGIGFEMHTVDQLKARFGDSPGWFYLYNVIGNASSTVVYVPLRGLFRVTAFSVFVGAALFCTAAVVVRFMSRGSLAKPMIALALLVPINALVGFMYIRPRVMFVAYVAIAALLVAAVSDVLKKYRSTFRVPPRAVVIGLLLLWSGLWVGAIGLLLKQASP